MAARCYCAAWTDSGLLLGCDHQHLTVVAAVVCAQSTGASGYVVAMEDGVIRELNDSEEREFQLAMYGTGVAHERVGLLKPISLGKAILN